MPGLAASVRGLFKERIFALIIKGLEWLFLIGSPIVVAAMTIAAGAYKERQSPMSLRRLPSPLPQWLRFCFDLMNGVRNEHRQTNSHWVFHRYYLIIPVTLLAR